jgi:hypothetical protein
MARQVTRWLELFPVRRFGLLDTYFIIPAFEITDIPITDVNDSYIITQFNAELGYNVSFKTITKPDGVDDFCLCVKYREDDVVTRYKLWSGVGEIMWDSIPDYNGEVIKGNMCFEVWTKVGSTTATLPEDLQIYTTLRRVPTSMTDYDDSVNATLESTGSMSNTDDTYPFDNSIMAHEDN